MRSYSECAVYLKELSDHKLQQLAQDEEIAETGTMDLMGKTPNLSFTYPL